MTTVRLSAAGCVRSDTRVTPGETGRRSLDRAGAETRVSQHVHLGESFGEVGVGDEVQATGGQ
jgi:hypothetical protein